MKEISISDFSQISDLKNLIETVHEKYYIELKKVSGNLPASFWETYSSFSNTSGGWIILGVEEAYPYNIISGVKNADKVLSDFWNQLSNPQKVSFRAVQNEDVQVVSVEESVIVIIYVHEVPDKYKPVYINDKMDNCYLRTGDGDRKCTHMELSSFLRNAGGSSDDQIAENFTMDDIDKDSLLMFKSIVNKRYPQKKYLEMRDDVFLVEIGGAVLDRITKEFKLKKGMILFAGKVNSIHELYSNYHVDFFNRRGVNPRWDDRVTDDEPGIYEMNLFNFYMIVKEKMTNLLNESFSLGNGQLRLPISSFDEPLREALVNCIIHADYMQGTPSVKVEAFDGWFHFRNPGKMLVSVEQFAAGGESKIRNEIIVKMFRLLGASERQGFGGPLIFKSALNNSFRIPEIYTDLDHTDLTVWAIDLVDAYPDLTGAERDCFRVIAKSITPVSVPEIIKQTGITDYGVRKAIEHLEERKLIEQIGNGKSTRFITSKYNIETYTKLQIMLENIKKNL